MARERDASICSFAVQRYQAPAKQAGVFFPTGVDRAFPNNQAYQITQKAGHACHLGHGRTGIPGGPRWPSPALGRPDHHGGQQPDWAGGHRHFDRGLPGSRRGTDFWW